VVRREFIVLVRLLRDVLRELSRLRFLVNYVVLEPGIAPKLKDIDASGEYTPTELQPERSTTASSLLAPISRWLHGADMTTKRESVQSRRVSAVSTSSTTSRPPPKLVASSALASATVNVEFGSGVVRRAVSVAPASGSGDGSLRQQAIAQSRGGSGRRELHSIFKGGAPSLPPGENWVVLGRQRGGRRPLPPQGSWEPGASTSSSRTMSSAVDAVVDTFAQTQTNNDEGGDGRVSGNLLERTLRPRGLSDSSLHSTFLSHGASPVSRLITVRIDSPS
jgi:hypothetical protein